MRDERTIKHIVIIRKTSKVLITPECRVYFSNGKYAQVVSTRDPDNTGEWIEIRCEGIISCLK
jgi:head-tail adaptor